jgi:V/A-type H+/Na+-transporting ATPase subunit E
MGRIGNIETLTEEILSQAKEQASVALEREQRISERDLGYAKEDAEKIKEQQRAKTQSIVETEEKKTRAAAEMEARRILLEKKEELVSRLFDSAESKLEEMRGSKAYLDIISRAIKDAISNIGNNLVVEFGEKDKSVLTKDVISSIQSNISKSLGLEVNLKFVPSSENIPAGVIIKSVDGRMIIDGSFPNLMRKLKEDLRGKISEILLQE